MIKNEKLLELHTKYTTVFLSIQTLKTIFQNTNVYSVIKIIKNTFDVKLMEQFLIYTCFLTTTMISFFYCCEKIFILMNIWMIGKNSLKLHYLKKKDFYIHLNIEDIIDAD